MKALVKKSFHFVDDLWKVYVTRNKVDIEVRMVTIVDNVTPIIVRILGKP